MVFTCPKCKKLINDSDEHYSWITGSWWCASMSIQEEIKHDIHDAEVNPAHYKELNPEPLAVIEAWSLPFHEAQVLKYISRAGRKGGEEKRVTDLKKARVYLDRRIEQLERLKK